ncbi:hypothetical protein EVAR_72452_1 [Eumeta japonica]|uniref:Uncharacterized protein n=1 Tax=Eumeta variegata TaxID=151549 RepID=A0A4C1TRM0_EUMVA|nr:hypothetical protein EVAR_72452_1 [Eumeta japonica]
MTEIPSIRHDSGHGFVWVTGRDYTEVSCYLIPNDSVDVEDAVLAIGKVIVAGDSQRKSIRVVEYCKFSGQENSDMSARCRPDGWKPVYNYHLQRPGSEGTIPDITTVSESFVLA